MGKKSPTRVVQVRPVIEVIPSDIEDGDSRFARALGSGDFHTRDQGLKALVAWLRAQDVVNETSLQKLWKGIMYCFWHSDKELVQRDLASRLAAIVSQVARHYFRVFLVTMLREWGHVDKLRLDKFMMLVRRFFNELFCCMAAHTWEKAFVMQYAKLILQHAFHEDDATCPVGFSMHVADVYVTEWARVVERTPEVAMPSVSCLKLLRPFLTVLQRTRQPVLLQRIRSSVFVRFLDLLRERDSASSSPWSRCNAQKIAGALSEAGAASGVRSRNRGALYDLAEVFQRCTAARAQATSCAMQRPKSTAAQEAAALHTNAVPGRTPNADKAAMADADDTVDAGDTVDAEDTVDLVFGSIHAAKAYARAQSTVHEQRRLHNGAASGSRRPENALGVSGAAKLSKTERKRAKRVAKQLVGKDAAKLAQRVADQSDASVAGPGSSSTAASGFRHDVMDEAIQGHLADKVSSKSASNGATGCHAPGALHNDKKGKKRRAPEHGLLEVDTLRSESVGCEGSLGALEAPLLAQAVLTVQAQGTPEKRKITFDLERNVTYQIGQEMPPSEMRTPPGAKPRGSALKKVSSLPQPQDMPLRKRLSFGGTASARMGPPANVFLTP